MSGHLFVGRYFGHVDHGFFRRYDANCPFSAKMDTAVVAGKIVASSCRSLVIPVHCHEQLGRSNAEVRKSIKQQLEFIRKHKTHPDAIAFSTQHNFWNEIALEHSKNFKEHLIDIEAVKVYCLNHPEKTAEQVVVVVVSLSIHIQSTT